MEKIKIELYTKERIPDVLAFEKQLRAEEDVWGWEIDDAYIKSVTDSFDDPRFQNALSLLAYIGEQVVGRIDVVRIPSYFDGTVKAYLDWICVLKSARHKGVAQALMNEIRSRLKAEGIDAGRIVYKAGTGDWDKTASPEANRRVTVRIVNK